MCDMSLDDWALVWGVPPDAVAHLRQIMTSVPVSSVGDVSGSDEAAAQSAVRKEAPKHGVYLWRNNVGACKDDRGRMIRYGLANDSKRINEVIKSHDLIGIRPVIITPGHVGTTIGQFVSLEVKRPNWRYTGAGREPAQLAWGNLITANGGVAGFTTGSLPDTLTNLSESGD